MTDEDIEDWLRKNVEKAGHREAAIEIKNLRLQIKKLEAMSACMANKLTRIVDLCGIFPNGPLQDIKEVALGTGLEWNSKQTEADRG